MRIGLMLATLLLLCACDQQSRGFSLPPGDAERGRSTFIELDCLSCHRVIGDELLGRPDPDAAIKVDLGGRVTHIKTYGDLVTSIINPSHRISVVGPTTSTDEGKSNMRVYNEFMTVQQLVDLVTFLQSRYEIYIPQTQFPSSP